MSNVSAIFQMLHQTNFGMGRSNYGKETVPFVDSGLDVLLNGTTVSGHVHAGTNLTALNAYVNSMNSGMKTILNGTTCLDSVQAGMEITAQHSAANSLSAASHINIDNSVISELIKAQGNIDASKIITKDITAHGFIKIQESKVTGLLKASNVSATKCESLSDIETDAAAEIIECQIIKSIKTAFLSLKKSTVNGDVFVSGQLEMENSTVKGKVTCTSNNLIIENSEIDTLEIELPIQSAAAGFNSSLTGVLVDNPDVLVSGPVNANAFGPNSTAAGVIGNRDSNKVKVVVGGAVNASAFGGATAAAVCIQDLSIGGQPDQAAQIQSQAAEIAKLKADLEALKAQLQKPAQQAEPDERKENNAKKEEKPVQVLELRNCTVKNVIFKGGNGEVALVGNSRVTGEITGGKTRQST